MTATAHCVHCLGPLRPPGLWSNAWQCDDHGACLPFFDAGVPTPGMLDRLRLSAAVPVWAPQPLPPSWVVSGIGWAGDDRTGARATAIACCGPAPLGGGAEVVFVAEEPGVGLAARLAGLPAAALQAGDGPGEAKITASHHPTPLWPVCDDGRARIAYAGEAAGVWLSLIFWPADASLLLLEQLRLVDLRDVSADAVNVSWLDFGAPSGRLSQPTCRAQAAPAGLSPVTRGEP